MIIDIPDEYTVSQKDFENMTIELAKLLMFFASRARGRVIVQKDPDAKTVTIKREASD